MNIKVKNGIAFNLDDPDQLKLYEHMIKRTNISAYLKRLIQRDMEGNVRLGIENKEIDTQSTSFNTFL